MDEQILHQRLRRIQGDIDFFTDVIRESGVIVYTDRDPSYVLLSDWRGRMRGTLRKRIREHSLVANISDSVELRDALLAHSDGVIGVVEGIVDDLNNETIGADLNPRASRWRPWKLSEREEAIYTGNLNLALGNLYDAVRPELSYSSPG